MPTSDELIFAWLPVALADIELIGRPSGAQLEIVVTGDDPATATLWVDEDGDLHLQPAPAERPRVRLELSASTLRSLACGDLRRRMAEAPGGRDHGNRLPARLLLPFASLARLEGVCGVAEVELRGGQAADRVRVAIPGAGPSRVCRVSVEPEMLVAFACGLVGPRAWARQCAGRIEGDEALFVEVVGALLVPLGTGRDFLFVHDRATGRYPLRFEIQSSPGDPCPEVHGAVPLDRAEHVLDALRRGFAEPAFVVERMWATSWLGVEENFAGLYDHE